MNNHLNPTNTAAHPIPLSARPETVKLRERLSTQKIVSQTIAEELGNANRVLNFLATHHHCVIHYGNGYYEVNVDGRMAYGADMRDVILEMASK